MPYYDFRCNDELCGEIFEAQLPMASAAKPACPVCAGSDVTKVILETPHVRLNWKAYDRNDTGSGRLVIRAGKAGRSSAMDDSADLRERSKVAHEFSQAGRPS